MKIKLKPKHFELGKHYYYFIDRRWYHDYQLNNNDLELFIRAESYGTKDFTAEELNAIKPLVDGKQNYELTLKMVHEEMADFWSNNWGWYWPIANTIKYVFKERSKIGTIYVKALIKILRNCYDNGFLEVLKNYTGLTQEQKDKYIENWIYSNAK